MVSNAHQEIQDAHQKITDLLGCIGGDSVQTLNQNMYHFRPPGRMLRDSTDSAIEFETLAKGQATFSILQICIS